MESGIPASGTAMRQYCSVCKADLEMSVVSDTNEDGVVWLKCPQCKGILPHIKDPGEDVIADGEPSASSVLDDFDIESARPYDPKSRYEIDDVVHHRGWDDYGVVVGKEELPGNRFIIRVRFKEQGETQLIEGAG